MFVTTPAIWTGGWPGRSRRVTSTSSSCTYWPGARPTENCRGVDGTVPTTRPSPLPPGCAASPFSPLVICSLYSLAPLPPPPVAAYDRAPTLARDSRGQRRPVTTWLDGPTCL